MAEGSKRERAEKELAEALKVTPPDGWTVHSPFGVLKTNKGRCLVRLEDVHAFLMQRDGIPSVPAAATVFSVFISDAASKLGMTHGAAKVRASLHIIDPADYPDSVVGFAGQLFMRRAVEYVPYQPHHRFDSGTVEAVIYAIGVIAGEVWAPHGKAAELEDRLDGHCSVGTFPTFAMGREIAGRFAVPFSVAHELWGWGRAAAIEALPEAVSSPPPLQAQDVNDWPSLVRYRLQFVGKFDQQRAEWTPFHVEILAAGLRSECADSGVRGAKRRLGEKLGLSGERVRQLLAEHDYNIGTGEKLKTSGGWVAGLGGRTSGGAA